MRVNGVVWCTQIMSIIARLRDGDFDGGCPVAAEPAAPLTGLLDDVHAALGLLWPIGDYEVVLCGADGVETRVDTLDATALPTVGDVGITCCGGEVLVVALRYAVVAREQLRGEGIDSEAAADDALRRALRDLGSDAARARVRLIASSGLPGLGGHLLRAAGIPDCAAVEAILEADRAAHTLLEDASGPLPQSLLSAARSNHPTACDVARLLIAHGADVNHARFPPLPDAIKKGTPATVALLVAAGADVQHQTPMGSTVLMLAVQHRGDIEIVQALIDAGADLEKQDLLGRSALSMGVEHERVEVVQLLLDRGVAATRGMPPPLRRCRGPRGVEVARLLLAHGADVNAADARGQTPLFGAADRKDRALMTLLLDHGADADAVDTKQMRPIFLLTAVGDAHLAELLVNHGASVNVADDTGATPLYIAAGRGAIDVVEVLLGHGAAADAACNGETPLARAGAEGHAAVVQKLCDHRAQHQ